jgi:hypothetical protein
MTWREHLRCSNTLGFVPIRRIWTCSSRPRTPLLLFSTFVKRGRFTLIGTKGVLRADPAYGYATDIKHQLTIGKKRGSKTFPKRDQSAAELLYFSDCILKDKEPEPSGIEGLADVSIVEAIYESARTKRTIHLPHLPTGKRPTMAQEIRRPAHPKPQVIHGRPPSREAA